MIRGSDRYVHRLGTWAMRRVMSDGRQEVFDGQSGVIDGYDVDVGPYEAKTEESSALSPGSVQQQ